MFASRYNNEQEHNLGLFYGINFGTIFYIRRKELINYYINIFI